MSEGHFRLSDLLDALTVTDKSKVTVDLSQVIHVPVVVLACRAQFRGEAFFLHLVAALRTQRR